MNLEATVNWPTIDPANPDGWTVTEEAGLQVFALWDEYMDMPTHANTVNLEMTGVFVGAQGPLKDRIDQFYTEMLRGEREDEWGDCKFGTAAAVQLAATPHAYLNYGEQEYFLPKRTDLTEEALAALEKLEALYGGEATLATFVRP